MTTHPVPRCPTLLKRVSKKRSDHRYCIVADATCDLERGRRLTWPDWNKSPFRHAFWSSRFHRTPSAQKPTINAELQTLVILLNSSNCVQVEPSTGGRATQELTKLGNKSWQVRERRHPRKWKKQCMRRRKVFWKAIVLTRRKKSEASDCDSAFAGPRSRCPECRRRRSKEIVRENGPPCQVCQREVDYALLWTGGTESPKGKVPWSVRVRCQGVQYQEDFLDGAWYARPGT